MKSIIEFAVNVIEDTVLTSLEAACIKPLGLEKFPVSNRLQLNTVQSIIMQPLNLCGGFIYLIKYLVPGIELGTARGRQWHH